MTLLGLVHTAAAQDAVPKPVPRPHRAVETTEVTHGRVFLLRGLANVFSLGLDKLAAKLKSRGIPARVTNHSHWRLFATLLISEYRTDRSILPVIIIGHSLGADAAVNMGNLLAENGVPVRLVVAFDGVVGGGTVVPGVDEVVNYYKPNGFGRLIKALPDFSGKLTNIDLSDRREIDHLNIEKADSLHEEVIDRVAEIFAEKPAQRKPSRAPAAKRATSTGTPGG